MAKIFNVAEAKEMEGVTLTGVSGKLKALYKLNSGKNDNGPWTLQNGVLESGGAEMKIVFSDREEVPKAFIGKPLTILSTSGERGLHGVKVKMGKEFKGKTELELKVTPTAEIVSGIESGSTPPPSATPHEEPPKASAPAPQQAAPAQPKQPTQQAAKPAAQAPSEVDQEMMKRINLADRILSGMEYLKKRHPDTVAAGVFGCVFISMEKAGLIEKMPTTPISKK